MRCIFLYLVSEVTLGRIINSTIAKWHHKYYVLFARCMLHFSIFITLNNVPMPTQQVTQIGSPRCTYTRWYLPAPQEHRQGCSKSWLSCFQGHIGNFSLYMIGSWLLSQQDQLTLQLASMRFIVGTTTGFLPSWSLRIKCFWVKPEKQLDSWCNHVNLKGVAKDQHIRTKGTRAGPDGCNLISNIPVVTKFERVACC